ncbi:uncharacterized protein Z518_06688 [Rhinocladiella mackenziei CBS 650.93]|uniref:Xylanolytic transcriptional activator regulatory domain-containing protein n=1 Tax=Rhinocladiella mackenziei CBS 650.93 TaxID=1442369 RepID=A0A0D2FMD1_9EURO|nr:uncharacterized protein Z518_06688 [Rhinocladiella mackenziei CBS 650.93]KIX03137.1 hypothetical protein Z518_06688 [Rhinocladiella mackenziei CBS 650.93]
MPRPSPPLSIVIEKEASVSDQLHQEFLKVSGALVLPPKPMLDALTDNFFTYLYHLCAVIDPQELLVRNPSLLLSQAICLAGSLVRQNRGHSFLSSSEQMYMKVKTLIMTNHEKDSHVVLKSICLLACWNVTPAMMVDLDCSYHWIGVAVRQMLQMGLHQDSTYVSMTNPGVIRRLAWHIYARDKLQSACFGRPALIKSHEFKVRPLEYCDFKVINDQAELFIQYVNLNAILGKMLELHSRKPYGDPAEAVHILDSLKSWINQLPSNLRLYTYSTDQRTYRRDVYEVHINYFVLVVMFFHLCGHAITIRTSTANLTSLIASSCIARLYEEMEYRDDIAYLLPINTWYIMVGCIPQVHQSTGRPNGDTICEDELNILRHALRTMANKYPPSRNVLYGIDRFARKRTTTGKNEVRRPLGISDLTGGRSNENDPGAFPDELVRELFPLPKTMCPRMDLLEPVGERREPSTMSGEIFPWDEQNPMDWLFDEFCQDSIDSYDSLLAPTDVGSEQLL